jgi:hypothetical protein
MKKKIKNLEKVIKEKDAALWYILRTIDGELDSGAEDLASHFDDYEDFEEFISTIRKIAQDGLTFDVESLQGDTFSKAGGIKP